MNYDVNLAHELHQIVFQPVEKHLGAEIKKLIIVPHHILYYLPFSALATQIEQKDISEQVLF